MTNGKLYHTSSKFYSVGDLIERNTRSFPFEHFVEEFRQKNAPSVPSRINAVFVAPLKDGRSTWLDRTKYLYEVEIMGNDWFLTDGEMYTEARIGYNEAKENVDGWLKRYFTPYSANDWNMFPEIVSQSDVRVIAGPFVNDAFDKQNKTTDERESLSYPDKYRPYDVNKIVELANRFYDELTK